MTPTNEPHAMPSNAIQLIAAQAVSTCGNAIFCLNSYARRARWLPVLALLAMAGCASVVDKPQRATVYDFGPGPAASSTAAALAPIVLSDIQASTALDSPAVLYRLAYANALELRPYAQARWSASPVQLVQQRLREVLGQRRSVVGINENVALSRDQAPLPAPLLLRLELEEFSHVFASPSQSVGLIRLRATLLEYSKSGDRLLGQRSLVLQRPAATADAAGGTQALASATDAAAQEIDQWLQQIR
jgi:cholesterol transport system auxiliary component